MLRVTAIPWQKSDATLDLIAVSTGWSTRGACEMKTNASSCVLLLFMSVRFSIAARNHHGAEWLELYFIIFTLYLHFT